MENELNGLQKGKLRWQKLKEAEESGKLSMAKNRYEVANLCGFTNEERNRGYNWVAGKIRAGQLEEAIHALGDYGKMEYEYHLIKEPDYDRRHAQALRWKDKTKEEKPIVKISENTNSVPTTYKVEIVRVETTIRVELHSYNEVSEFVKTILKGE